MMRPGPNYRMSKNAKIYLSRSWARPGRRARKNMIIEAELHAAQSVKHKRDKDH